MRQPEVVFYVLASSAQPERQDFACKLIEKIYRGGQFCYVLTDNEQQPADIDRQLWTFRAGSFVPHQILKDRPPAYPGTVLIGGKAIPDGWQHVVVNLSIHYPPTTAPTERIVEILDGSEDSKQAGRLRFQHYRNAGLTIVTHKQEGGRWLELPAR